MTDLRDGIPDSEPVLARKNRRKGFTKSNVVLVSHKAGWLMDNYRKDELLKRIAAGDPVPGYDLWEMQRIADGLVN